MFEKIRRAWYERHRRWVKEEPRTTPGARSKFIVTVPCMICGRPHAMAHSRGRLAMVECHEHRDPVQELRKLLVFEDPANLGSHKVKSITYED